LLGEKKPLLKQVEWPGLPVGMGEAPVLRQRLDDRLPAARGLQRVQREAAELSLRLDHQLLPLGRRGRQMRRPVQVRADERGRRQTLRDARQRRVQQRVGGLRERGERILGAHAASVRRPRSAQLIYLKGPAAWRGRSARG
jgi:hypothetical protein